MAPPRKYHINDKGEAGLCTARSAKCPFGDASEHYDSKDDARAAYENKMAQSLEHDNQLDTSKLSASDLNRLAKTSQSPQVMIEIVKRGSARALANLAKNPLQGFKTPERILATALKRKPDDRTRMALLRHPKFDPTEMSDDEFVATVRSYDQWHPNMNKLIRSSRPNDIISRELDSPDYNRAFVSHDNALSSERVAEIADSDRRWLDPAIGSGRYPLAQKAEEGDLSRFENVWAGLSKSPDVEGVNALARRAVRESNTKIISNVMRNPGLGAPQLQAIADLEFTDHYGDSSSDLFLQIYRHPNAPQDLREKLIQQASLVASYSKLQKLDDLTEGRLGDIIGSGAEGRVAGSTQRRVVQFNPNEVKRLGLTPADIDCYVRHFRGNYLFGADYVESTGTYSGFID